MIYLDTHAVVWLYAGLTRKFSDDASQLMDEHDLYVSEVVRLELQYLFEIGRVTVTPEDVLESLSNDIGLQVTQRDMRVIIDKALSFNWTHDVFDRIITAEADVEGAMLVTKNETIRANYENVVC